MHVVDKFSISLQFERRLLYTSDPQWPKATLSGTLPSLVLHVNEQKVHHISNTLVKSWWCGLYAVFVAKALTSNLLLIYKMNDKAISIQCYGASNNSCQNVNSVRINVGLMLVNGLQLKGRSNWKMKRKALKSIFYENVCLLIYLYSNFLSIHLPYIPVLFTTHFFFSMTKWVVNRTGMYGRLHCNAFLLVLWSTAMWDICSIFGIYVQISKSIQINSE